MLENDRMETASTEVTSIRRRSDSEKSTWRTHQYFVDFESRIHVEISTSNRCHNFHVDSPFQIDVISTNFPRGILTSNRWRVDKGVSIGCTIRIIHNIFLMLIYDSNKHDKWSIKTKILNFWTRSFMNHCSHLQVLFEHWQITNSNNIVLLKRLLSCINYRIPILFKSHFQINTAVSIL